MSKAPMFKDNYFESVAGFTGVAGFAVGVSDSISVSGNSLESSVPCPWQPPVGRCILDRAHGRPHLLEVEAAAMDAFAERIKRSGS